MHYSIGTPKILKALIAAIVVLFILSMACIPFLLPKEAFGAGVSIPERFSDLCQAVGAPPSCTKIISKAGGTVTFVVSLNDNVALYGAGGHSAHVAAKLRGNRFAGATYYDATQAPCFFHSCVVGSYAGPSEADIITSVPVAVGKLQYQMAEGDLATQLHVAFGDISIGVPYIDRVYPTTAKVFDGTGSSLDTTLAVRVKIRFALSGE